MNKNQSITSQDPAYSCGDTVFWLPSTIILNSAQLKPVVLIQGNCLWSQKNNTQKITQDGCDLLLLLHDCYFLLLIVQRQGFFYIHRVHQVQKRGLRRLRQQDEIKFIYFSVEDLFCWVWDIYYTYYTWLIYILTQGKYNNGLTCWWLQNIDTLQTTGL